jgi:hypothetical protein
MIPWRMIGIEDEETRGSVRDEFWRLREGAINITEEVVAFEKRNHEKLPYDVIILG